MELKRNIDLSHIPAVNPGVMDAGFFARLRMIDDDMFLTAAFTSAMRGNMVEVLAAFSTLHTQNYEPLMFSPSRKEGLIMKVPTDPTRTGLFGSEDLYGYFRTSIWNLVALSMTRPLESASKKLTKACLQSTLPDRSEERQKERDALFETAMWAVIEQSERILESQGIRSSVRSGRNEDIHDIRSVEPWSLFCMALAKEQHLESYLIRLLENTPRAIIDLDPDKTQEALHSFFENQQLDAARLMVDLMGKETLKKCFSLHQSSKKDILSGANSLANVAIRQNSLRAGLDPEEAVQKTLDLTSQISAKLGSQESHHFLGAMLRSTLSARRLMKSSQLDDFDEPLTQLILALLPENLHDMRRGFSDFDFFRSILEEAIELHDSRVVQWLEPIWNELKDQVSPLLLLQIQEKLPFDDPQTNRKYAAEMNKILQVAKSVGIDLDQCFSYPGYFTKPKKQPAHLLHAIGDRLNQDVAIIMMTELVVGLGLNPNVRNSRGSLPRKHLTGDNLKTWDTLVKSVDARAKIYEILSRKSTPEFASP